MSNVVSRHQQMAEAMDAERTLAGQEAAENKPDNEVSAAARALRQAGVAKKQQVTHPKEEPAQELAPDEEETAAPGEGEEPSDPQQEGGEPDVQAITVNGKRITAEEVLRDYVPKAEYTRKTMAHSEKERQFVAESQARLSRLDSVIQAIQADVGQKSDPSYWLGRAQEVGNDVAFSERLQWEAQATKLAQAEQAKKEESQKLLWQQIAQRDVELTDYNAAWSETEVRNKDYEAIAKYAFSEGYTHEELAHMTQARYLRSLDKARKYDDLVNTGKLASKELIKKPPVQKPGARNPQTNVANQQIAKAMERFDRNPTRQGLMELERLQAKGRA